MNAIPFLNLPWDHFGDRIISGLGSFWGVYRASGLTSCQPAHFHDRFMLKIGSVFIQLIYSVLANHSSLINFKLIRFLAQILYLQKWGWQLARPRGCHLSSQFGVLEPRAEEKQTNSSPKGKTYIMIIHNLKTWETAWVWVRVNYRVEKQISARSILNLLQSALETSTSLAESLEGIFFF